MAQCQHSKWGLLTSLAPSSTGRCTGRPTYALQNKGDEAKPEMLVSTVEVPISKCKIIACIKKANQCTIK